MQQPIGHKEANNKEWSVNAEVGKVFIESNDSKHNVRLYVVGEFESIIQHVECANDIEKKLNNELLCDVELLKKQRNYFEQSHLTALKEINEMQETFTEKNKFLTLIHNDLKMRADENGVVNISNFIWEVLQAYDNT